ncbi:unnamed protein product [Phytophthora fragariaefolia]|uniref:Unnamed protein product n=1 Tax=Phytophthora fragariaefolia TaxID=1490495 RepID=A0A9W6XKT2_9STRA|nr:unnamed protein product [Phytophthora fragariaefolia]
MNSTLSRMMEHVQKFIEDKLVGCTVDVNTDRIIQQQMEKSTDHVAATVIEHVLKPVDDKLATSQGGASLTQEAAQIIQKRLEMSREGIAAEVIDHVQQLVEGKLAAALHGASLNPEMSEIVKLQVALATEGVASAIKRSVEQDLQKACGSIHDELLRCAQDVNGPLYESVREFISETTARADRQLESRIQKLHTNTQSDINLQVQRQADVTTALREHVMKMCVRVNKQNQQTESASLESTIARLVKKDVDQCIKALQSKDPQSVEHAVRQDRRPAEQTIPSQNPIKHSL